MVCATLVLFGGEARADKRVALVIGNSAYQNVRRLDNPKNDAVLMAKTLQGLGFTLVNGGAQLDLDKPSLDAAVQSFGQKVEGADVALFYYAGHGVQINGSNYLVPVNRSRFVKVSQTSKNSMTVIPRGRRTSPSGTPR